MRRSLVMLARLVIAVVMLGATARPAQAITLTEIMELTRAGLSDEVILALIEVDHRVFAIDPDTLKTLKDAGVSPRVIVAIVRSGRSPQPRPDPIPSSIPSHINDEPRQDPPDPQVVVVERPVVHEVQIAVPVYVAVGGRSRTRHREQPYVVPPTAFVPFGTPVAAQVPARPEPPKRAEPVYWGWGGKLRPDAWQPDPRPHKR